MKLRFGRLRSLLRSAEHRFSIQAPRLTPGNRRDRRKDERSGVRAYRLTEDDCVDPDALCVLRGLVEFGREKGAQLLEGCVGRLRMFN